MGKLIPNAKEEIWVKVVFGKRLRMHTLQQERN